MLDNLKIKILYQIKVLEYKFQAWIKVFEISKAYSQEEKKVDLKRVLQKSWRLALYGVFLILGTGAVWGIFKLVQLKPFSNPEAAITAKNPDQNPKEFSVRDSLLKSMVEKEDVLQGDNSFTASIEKFAKDSAAFFGETSSSHPVDYFIIMANKKNKTMYLLQNTTGKWQVLRTYSMGIGAQSGRKVTAGDKRTPEGLYFIVERKEKRELSSIYGPLAYVLDYPNHQDRQEGRTGQGIWIHGTDPDSFPGETKGCLEIANDQLLLLASFLKDGIGTPVLIVGEPETDDPLSIPDFEMIHKNWEKRFALHKRSEEEFKTLIENWEKAWESKDIKRYKDFYDTSGFYSQGMGWKSWEERKIRTFEMYSNIEVTVDKILVMDVSEDSATIKFLQIYKSDKNRQQNGKQMILGKINGSWKITREVTIPKEELLL